MGYSKAKKEKRKGKSSESVSEKFMKHWEQKRPVIFFVGGFSLLMFIFYLFWNSDFFEKHIHYTIISVNAFLSSKLLNVFGLHTQHEGAIIFSSVYSISVSKGCDAIEAMALFLSTTLAFPMKWKIKIRGMFLGIVLLATVNLFRIVTLFLAGVYYPDTFDMLHTQVWPVIIIIFATGLWIFLIQFDQRNKKNVTK